MARQGGTGQIGARQIGAGWNGSRAGRTRQAGRWGGRRGGGPLGAVLLAALLGAGPALGQSAAEELAAQAAAAAAAASAAEAARQGRPAARDFPIRRIVPGPSAYLPAAELAALARRLEGQGLRGRDIPAILAAFDALYDARDIALAQAVLSRSDPRAGSVEIGFVEARIGQVSLQGSLARPEVYAARLGLGPGELADTRILNARLERLALQTGIRSDLAFSPGARAGLTDLAVRFEEPARRSFAVTLDSFGSVATGRGRLTLSYSDRSLTGRLDSFGASLTLAEGLASGAVSYALPVTGEGTALFASLSGEQSRNLTGPAVSGSNTLLELGISHPLVVTAAQQFSLRASTFAFADRRNTAGVPTTRQSGGGILLGAGYAREWPGATRLGLDLSLRHVAWQDSVAGLSGLNTTYLTAEASFDTPLGEALALTLRGGAQGVRGDQAPAQFRAGLASQSRVRGYPSGQLSGDQAVWASAQLRLRQPVALGPQVRMVPFAFVDTGRAWDRAGGVTALQGTALSVGLGASFGIGRNGSADIVLARPLNDLPGFAAQGWRLDASFVLRF